jgi:hypothetical protein
MGEKLARIFEYRVLYARHRDLQIALTPNEADRLARLREQLPDRVPTLDERDPLTLLAVPLPAHFVAAGHFGSGTLRNASATGLAIATFEEPPALGQRLILHAQDPEQAIEYTFPCRVVLRVVKGTPSMGVAFEGVPSQALVGQNSSGVWRSDAFPAGQRASVKPSRGTGT